MEPPDLTREALNPDGEWYTEHVVQGIRLTREPGAWVRTWLLISVDVPLDVASLAAYRVLWDSEHESYDLPVDMVNSSPRRWVRDEDTVIALMISHGEDEMGEKAVE